jgi:hypothetical protein
VLLGANEQQIVAALYFLGSLVQFGAYLLLIRALFPGRVVEQSVALLIFLLVPYNHSIHHYRDVPVVLACSAIFLLAAHFVDAARRRDTAGQPAYELPSSEVNALPTKPTQRVSPGDQHPAPSADPRRALPDIRDVVWVGGAMFLGLWSRTEVLTFVFAVCLLGACVWRQRIAPLIGLYLGTAALVMAALLVTNRLEGIDTTEAARYQWHTFLDSTPESWLTADCRAQPTENCRERDGLTYFGPAPAEGGVLPMLLAHPWTALLKTAQSGWDNLWTILGPNLSTFPGIAPFLLIVLAFMPLARAALSTVSAAAWIVALGALAETVLPPLSWAPPHPQYHLQLLLVIVVTAVPVLVALAREPRGRLLATAFFVANAALSAFRYTRYPGY